MSARRLAGLLVTALAIATPALATADDMRTVAAMQGHARVLLVFAPSMRDARLEAQRQTFSRFAAGAAERDLLLVQVAEQAVIGARDKADKLRRTYRIDPRRYRSLLLGKDGRVALDAAGPIDAAHLTRAIDAMPMRQAEVRRIAAGQGKPKD